MKKRIDQFINGEFEYERPALILSEEMIQAIRKPGEDVRGEFVIQNVAERKIRGFLVSNHRRILLNTERFYGKKIEVSYGVDVTGLVHGDKVEGTVFVYTELGEKRIEFCVEIQEETILENKVESLDAFVEIAKKNYREAFRLFKDRAAFSSIYKSLNEKQKAAYLGLTENPITYQSLEEFLVQMKKKESARLLLGRKKGEYYDVLETVEEYLEVRKENWGYLEAEVFGEGDFLEIERKNIREEDFIGSVYRIPFVIYEDKLRNGKNYGKIVIRNFYQTIEYPILVTKGKDGKLKKYLQDKKWKLQFVQDYLALRTHKLGYKDWIESSNKRLNLIRNKKRITTEYQLYQAYILYQQEKIEEAIALIEPYSEAELVSENIELAGLREYLAYVFGAVEDRKKSARKIYRYYIQKEDSVLLFLLWLEVDEQFAASPRKKIFAIEEQYEKGSRSPMLYQEAWEIIARNAEILKSIDGFWTQVFLYAGKNNLLTGEIAMRILYLSGYEKKHSKNLFRILEYAYEVYTEDDAVESICKYCIKDSNPKKEYFRWYEKAVERRIRITSLFEYYMDTIDLSVKNRKIPKSLLLYFTYNNTLSDDKKAYLYAQVISNRYQEREIYQMYLDEMEEFAKKAVKAGKYNENYAAIYQEMNRISEEFQQIPGMEKMIFTYEIQCQNPEIRYVIVRNSEIEKEEVFPIIRGVAYPQIYTQDAVLIFEDYKKHRYLANVRYDKRKVIQGILQKESFAEREPIDPGMVLYLYANEEISERNFFLFYNMAKQEVFTQTYRAYILENLLTFLFENRLLDEVDEILDSIEIWDFVKINQTKVLEILIEKGRYRQAYRIIREVGCEHLQIEFLLKMVSRLILENEFQENEELEALSLQIYKAGKYDDIILKYLMKYTQGPIEVLLELRESAKNFQLECFRIEEKIIRLLLFLCDDRKEGEEVFRSYTQKIGNEKVIQAYLTFLSFQEIISERKMEMYSEKCLKTLLKQKAGESFICRLALLKRISEKTEFSEAEVEIAGEILEECREKKLEFAFFEKLPAAALEKCQEEDRIFVEYKGRPKDEVTLFYSLDLGDTEGNYQSEKIEQNYQGYFTKSFILFFGERIRYYFEVKREHEVYTTELQTRYMDKTADAYQTKFQRLNKILYDWDRGDKMQVVSELEEYLKKEQYMKNIFTIEKEQ